MSSLAKQILRNRHEQDTDEFGIPLKTDSGKEVAMLPQYLVARTFLLEQKDPRYTPDSIHRLYRVRNEIFRHHEQVDMNEGWFYELTGVIYKVPKHIQIAYWRELIKRLPELDTSIYKIADGVWWDKRNGEVLEATLEEIREKVKERYV